MRIRYLFLAALPAALMLFAACGDGADTSGTPTVAATEEGGTPAATPRGHGPAPVLGGNIEQISPAHAASVPRASTITRDPGSPRGVCATVNFDGVPTNGQAFRFIVDGQDVTAAGETVWILPDAVSPTGGTFCFSPKAGLQLGRHTAAIGVQASANVTDDYKQIVAWAFDVTE